MSPIFEVFGDPRSVGKTQMEYVRLLLTNEYQKYTQSTLGEISRNFF